MNIRKTIRLLNENEISDEVLDDRIEDKSELIKDKKTYDRMLDIAMSSLADFNDNTNNVIDYMDSNYGRELDSSDWSILEEELENYVNSLE